MKKLIILLTILSSYVGHAQQKVWSIQDCMEYAIKNNIQIQQQSLLIQDAEINIKDAKGAFLPNLGATASSTWFNNEASPDFRTTDYSVGTQMPIFNGFQNKNTLKIRTLEKKSNELTIGATKDDIRIDIANAYLQILLQQENLALLQAQYKLTQEQIELTKNLVEAGTTPEGDLLDLKAIGATDLQNIVNSENSVAIAFINLKLLLNIEFDIDFDIEKMDITLKETVLLDKPIKEIINKVLGIRNEVKLAEQNIEIAKQQEKITKGAYLPTVSGFANLGESETTSDGILLQANGFGTNYGLSVSVPLFNRFATKNAVSRNQVNTLRNEYQLEQAKLQVTQNVYQTYLDAKASKKSYEAAQTAVEAQQLAFNYAQNRYEVGISNSLDFSQAKLRLQNTQTQLIQAKYSLLFQLKLLELYYLEQS